MNAAGVLGLALLVLTALLVLLAVAVAARRAQRLRSDRRRAAVAEPLRPLLMELAAGEPEEAAAALEQLAALDQRTWSAVEPTVESLLLKVRGETRAAVVGLLERRGSLARAVSATRSRSVVARAHGAEVLGAAGRRSAVPDLLRLLRDPDPEVRQVAARSLGRTGAVAAAGPLLECLGSDHDVPPRIVATAVLRIGAGAHPAIAAALRSAEPLRRAIAAEIAGLSGAVATTGTLVDLLGRDPELEVRLRCARALGRIGSPVATPGLLRAVDEDQPTALRVVGARALGDLGDLAAVERLAGLATAPQHRLAANAASALTRCGQPGLRALTRLAARPDGAHARDVLAGAALLGLKPASDRALPAPAPPESAPAGGVVEGVSPLARPNQPTSTAPVPAGLARDRGTGPRHRAQTPADAPAAASRTEVDR